MVTEEGEMMGAITKATGQAVAKKPEPKGFEGLLRRSWPRMSAMMPTRMSPERMFQLAMSAYNQTPGLAQCSPASVLSCLAKCSALGMEPSAVDGLGRAYILPFKNKKTGSKEATFILGYKGMIDLARRSGQLADISARIVHEGDEFEYEFGLNEFLRHIPSTEPLEGRKPTHAYMVAHFKDGGHYVDVMSAAEIEQVRKRSKTPNFGPWVTDWEAMARKTVIRRAFPYLPVSVEASSAERADDTTPVIEDADGESLFPEIEIEHEQETDPDQVPGNVDLETGEIKE